MRADNSHHIVTAARRRADATRRRAIAAIRRMDNAGQPISFDAVAREGQVSRSWLYNQPDLRAEIERLRARRDPGPTAQRLPDRQRASDASQRRRLEVATERNRQLEAENRHPSRGTRGRPRRTARSLHRRSARRHAEKEISTHHRTLLTHASTTPTTKHRCRSTSQATSGLKITLGEVFEVVRKLFPGTGIQVQVVDLIDDDDVSPGVDEHLAHRIRNVGDVHPAG